MSAAARPERGSQLARIGVATAIVGAAVLLFVAADASGGIGPFDRAVVSCLALLPALAVPGLVAIVLRPVDHRAQLAVIAVVAALLGVIVAWPLWTSLASLCAANALPFSPLGPTVAGVGTAAGVTVALVTAIRQPTAQRALLLGSVGALVGGGIVLAAVAFALAPTGECVRRPSV